MTDNLTIIQPEVTVIGIENHNGIETYINLTNIVEVDDGDFSGLILEHETVTVIIEQGQIVNVDAGVPGPPASDRNGGVWCLSVSPVGDGAIGRIDYLADGKTIGSFLTSADVIRLNILALSGHTTYVPNVLINESPVALTESGLGIFTASPILDVSALSEIEIKHEDGPKYVINILRDVNPTIMNADIIQEYPSGQTELKAGDLISVSISADIPINRIVFENSGIGSGQTINVPLGLEHVVQISAPNRGNVALDQKGLIRVYSETNAESELFETANSIVLNNVKPSISFGTITYPIGQLALKNDEVASVVCNVSNFTTIQYTSPNFEITNPNLYELNKSIKRLSGDYVITNNFTVSAFRQENGSSATSSTCAKIANVAPTISITKSATRFRSGGSFGTSAQLHQLTVVSNQSLLNAPSISIPVGIVGAVGGSNMNWMFPVQINDSHEKGTHGITLIRATGLSGIETSLINGSNLYVVGGFVKRTMTVGAYPTRSINIGTVVTDTAKLRCSNLSKGLSGSYNFSYKNSIDDELNKYTILNNNEWYNCDGLNATANTAGTMLVELEELV